MMALIASSKLQGFSTVVQPETQPAPSLPTLDLDPSMKLLLVMLLSPKPLNLAACASDPLRFRSGFKLQCNIGAYN